MAIYHLSVKIIGRNAGRSSVAAAAYRAGECLVNEYDGIEHDFRRKNWVEYSNIILPSNAPEEYLDRGTLWNSVEQIEKSKDAQLCREFELALPVEMTFEEQKEIVERFVESELSSQGMIADIAIHNPPVTNDRHQPLDLDGNLTKDADRMQFINPHAHILVTMRPIGEDGKWLPKSKTEYLCIRSGEERGFTAEEYKSAKEEGWEKQYKYIDGTKKIWLTAGEGEDRGLKRINRSPKTTPYGRKNELIATWNSQEKLIEWREAWEKVVNEALASIKSDARVDCRSFEDQGRIDEIPTLHMGPAATNMERRVDREITEGKSGSNRSDVGDINRQIKEHNRLVKELKLKLEATINHAKDFVSAVASKLESIRSRIIGNGYLKSVLESRLKSIRADLTCEKEKVVRYNTELEKVVDANNSDAKEVDELKNKYQSVSSIHVLQKRDIKKQIRELQDRIEVRCDYKQKIATLCGFSSADEYRESLLMVDSMSEKMQVIEKRVENVNCDTDDLLQEYKSVTDSISLIDKSMVDLKRYEIRANFDSEIIDTLKKTYKDDYCDDIVLDITEKTDRELKLMDQDMIAPINLDVRRMSKAHRRR